MIRTPVKSSNIAEIGYDNNEKLLEVKFLRGQIYKYKDVPPQVFSAFLTSRSPGTYFQNYVAGKYPMI